VYVATATGQRIPVEINAWALEDGAHDRETPLFQGVFRDISERLAYERRLEEQRNGLEVLNQILRHDIRNDLQLVSAYADILTDHVDEDGAEYVATIQESAANAVELTQTARNVADVLLSSENDRRPVNLRTALETKLDEIRSEHPEAVITVEGAVPSATIVADEMLDSVFRNLLTNAIQHNDAEITKVRVGVAEDDDAVTIRIADNGPGIPGSQTESIFGKGEKGLESEGTGIGLHLVESLVDRYGGDVWIDEDYSQGAAFVVELPVADSE
jgi:signal transduction histidine kinase